MSPQEYFWIQLEGYSQKYIDVSFLRNLSMFCELFYLIIGNA